MFVKEQHDAFGVISFCEFVGTGVLEFLDIDGAAGYS